MADKKKKKSKGRIRKKVIRTANGLQVVWIDVATGKQVNDTNGWDIVSGNDADFPTTSSSTSTSSLEDELNDILGIDDGSNDASRPTDKPSGNGGGGSKVPYRENLTDTPKNTTVVKGGIQGLFDAAQSIGLFGGGLGMIGKLLGVKDNVKVDTETGEPIEQSSVADRIVEHFTGGGEDPDGDGEAIVEPPTVDTTIEPSTSVSSNSTNTIDTTIEPLEPSTPLTKRTVKTVAIDAEGNPILPTPAIDPFGTYVADKNQSRLTPNKGLSFNGEGYEGNFVEGKTNTGNYRNYKPSGELESIVNDLKTALTKAPNAVNSGARSITTQGVQPAGSVQMPPGARPSNIPDNSSELQLLNKMNTDVSAFPEERRGNTGNVANYVPPIPPVDPIKKSYLDLINAREGSPGYNEAFNYVPFNDLSKHPNIYNKEHDTSAAGRYQINAPTWNEFAPKVGVTDFSPESQDKVAWKIAEENYKVKTGGGDLYAALKSGDPATIATAFTKNRNRWVSLPASQGTAWGLVEQFTQSVKPVTPPNPMPYRPATSPTNKTYYGLPTTPDGSIDVQERGFSTATGFAPKSNDTPAPEFAGSNPAPVATGFAARPSTRDNSGVASEGSSVGGGVSNYSPSQTGWSNTPPRQLPTHTGGAVGGSKVGGSTSTSKSTGLGAASTAAGGVSKPSSGFGTRPTKPGEY